MKVKIKPISDHFKVPTYGTKGAACFDLYSAEKVTILPGVTTLVNLGFKIEVPEGLYMEIRPRSGMGIKQGMLIPNSPGTIDSDYRGDAMVGLLNASGKNFTVDIGDRIAQGMIKKYETTEFEVVDELTETERGEGGIGSTGI